MPQPTKQQWMDYLALFHSYLADVNLFIQNGIQGDAPAHPQPPSFVEGWGWQNGEDTITGWQQYASLANSYQDELVVYVDQYVDNGENPRPPLPAKPPRFNGWA